ncbi:hypothetical protein [Flagellimonas sp. CMM7]|nr:hypothetical protein [Flagellimonas sp. CMM7]UII79680.1 hypothetical protein LV704_18715 [Flagellimonas sp. CMM7]
MNTKRLFFGLLAVAFLAMTAVSTDVINVDEDQTVNIDKKKFVRDR